VAKPAKVSGNTRRHCRNGSQASAHADSSANRFFLEFTLDDAAALGQEWNHTDRAERLYQAGHRLMARGFFPEAAAVFKRAARYDRAHYAAYLGRSEALILAGEEQAAAQVIDHALERYGRNCQLGAARGHVFLHQNETDLARECTEIAVRDAPESAYVWVVAGEFRLAIPGGLKFALDCFDRARAAPERWVHVDLRIALACLEWGRVEQARHLLHTVVKTETDLPLAWILLGDTFKLTGNRREWRACYRRAAAMAPELQSLKHALGWKHRLSQTWREMWRFAARMAGAR